MIKSFESKALSELWTTGKANGIDAKFQRRVMARLTALNSASIIRDMDIPGFRLHALKGKPPIRYSVWVNGPWRITFEFESGDASRVDLEQYH